MDINNVTVSGKITNIGVNYTTGIYPVVEAKLVVNVGSKDAVPTYSTFNVRSYGKKSNFIATLKEGEFVTVSGRLTEDIRVNSHEPTTVRSKVYINIDRIKAFSNIESNLGD